jgi:hypothetical protein
MQLLKLKKRSQGCVFFMTKFFGAISEKITLRFQSTHDNRVHLKLHPTLPNRLA